MTHDRHARALAAPRRWRAFALIAAATLSVASCNSPLFGCRQEQPDPKAPAPDSFVVRFTTSRGPVDVVARKQWAPLGSARLYALVHAGYFDDNRFFRVIKDFAAQFGIAGDPKVTAAWKNRCIADEPVRHQNERGTLSFARGKPNTRSTQLFFNLVDNTPLDTLDTFGFPPVGQVVSGMEHVDSLYSGYGDSAPRSGAQYGREGPTQDSIMAQGNAYLTRGWPKLDYIVTARVTQEWRSP